MNLYHSKFKVAIDSPVMTCCAECQLPVLLLRRAGSVFMCAISQNAFWFCTVNLKHMCKLFVQYITTLR